MSGHQRIRKRLFFVHVFALCNFAMAQPIYSWITNQPEFLVAHALNLPMALFLTMLLSALLPAIIVASVLILGIFGERIGGYARALTAGVLAGLFALYLSSSVLLPIALSVAMLSGGISAFAYHRWNVARDALTVLGLMAVAFPLVFLLTDPVRSMIFSQMPEEVVSAEDRDTPSTTVVLVVLDQLPVGSLLNADARIDEQAFPNFARLADESTWYRYATTPHGQTAHALPAVVTGRLPSANARLPQWHDHPENLFLFAAEHYADAVLVAESLTRLCPSPLCQRRDSLSMESLGVMTIDVMVLWGHAVLPRKLSARYLPGLEDRWNNFLDLEWDPVDQVANHRFALANRVDQWRGFVNELGHGFHFAHVFLPHTPYWHLPDGRGYYRKSFEPVFLSPWATPGLNVVQYQRHLAQLQFTDRLLGELIDRMKAIDLWDTSLIIVTADHGKSFRYGTRIQQITPETLGDVLNVPLFVKEPDQRAGRVDDFPASLIDITPTISEAVGRPLEWRVDGVSLLASDRPMRDTIHVSCVRIVELLPACSDKFVEEADVEQIVTLSVEDIRREHFGSWKQETVFYSEKFDFFLPRHRYDSLLGQRTENYQVWYDSTRTAELFDETRFRNVASDGGAIPALVTGHIDHYESEQDLTLAVEINGTIAGLARPVHHDGMDGFFAALVAPSVFVPGANEVYVYEIVSSGDEHGEGTRARAKATDTPILIRLSASGNAGS